MSRKQTPAQAKKALAAAATAIVTIPKKNEAPARTICNMIAIENHFKEKVLDQPTSIRRLSYTLSEMLNRCQEDIAIYLWTLSGPSGTGKTRTARELRHFLGMDEGYEYEEQYVEFDASANYGGDEIANRDCHDVIDRLSAAKQTPSPYLFLFIHGFDEASYVFKQLIYCLVRDGHYKTSNGTHFKLPKDTALLIVCGCHYGKKLILDMTSRCDDAALIAIKQDMRRSIPDQMIERIDLILPYYPLRIETRRILLGIKYDSYIQNSRLVKRYGIAILKSSPAGKEMLINHVLSKIDKDCGMHSKERELKDKMNSLFESCIAVMEGMHQRHPTETIYLEKFSFDTQRFGEILNREFDKVTAGFLTSIKDNPANQQYLDKCDPGRNGKVDALTMRYGEEIPLCGLIMNITYITVNNYYGDEETEDLKDSNKRLEEKNKKLKGCLLAVNAAAEKEQHGTINAIIKNNKELFNESSDESGEEKAAASPLLLKRKASREEEENAQNKKPRVEEVIEVENGESQAVVTEELYFSEDMTSHSTDDISFSELLRSEEEPQPILSLQQQEEEERSCISRSKGIDGFTRCELKNKCYTWQCNRCEKVVSRAKYTHSHVCELKTKRRSMKLSI